MPERNFVRQAALRAMRRESCRAVGGNGGGCAAATCLQLLNRLRMRMQQQCALLLPRFQLRVTVVICSGHDFVTLCIKLLQAGASMRLRSRLLRHAAVSARRDKLSAGSNILIHALKCYNTQRVAVALCLVDFGTSRPAVARV